MQPCGTCALEPMKYGPHPQLLQMYVAVYRVSVLCLVCSALVCSPWTVQDLYFMYLQDRSTDCGK